MKILKLTFVLLAVSGFSVWVYVLLSRLYDDALSAITMSTVGFLVVGVIVMFFQMYMNAERSMSHRERMYKLETGKGEKAQERVQIFIVGTDGQQQLAGRKDEGVGRRAAISGPLAGEHQD